MRARRSPTTSPRVFTTCGRAKSSSARSAAESSVEARAARRQQGRFRGALGAVLDLQRDAEPLRRGAGAVVAFGADLGEQAAAA